MENTCAKIFLVKVLNDNGREIVINRITEKS